jgi:hypothetical protein
MEMKERRQAIFVTSGWKEATTENNGLVKLTAGVSDLRAYSHRIFRT